MVLDPSNHHKGALTSKRRSRKDALRELLSHFHSKDQVLITIDPDPDAIGSALAVKRLLWHRVQSVTIGIIRPIRRLNNQTLARLLKLPLVQLKQCELPSFDRYVVVDGQPHHNDFFRQFAYTAVIDHHPASSPVEAPYVDVRPHYGATSTILSEYLKAAAIKPSQTLATALLYGIKTDTRSFERHTIVEDIEAFRSLYDAANHNVLRKVEISDLSIKELKFFHKAVERKHVVRDRIFVHLDEVTSADILVEIAEFFLKIHDISWSIVSGIYEENLIIVIRNDGYRKDAGKLVRRAFGTIGCAGGHSAMARAEVPMEKLVQAVGKRSSAAIERYIRKRMSHAG
ncbi:MAG: DHH family phosphoesterase [Syntrophobacteraceae bacterium]|jgi:nanoRNase/pAp phosphatase (c-di-AMP/oligoRNAs hydrolase)|nr:DHH family phosphoesterase [Syntrophobacteraceae bacterium]